MIVLPSLYNLGDDQTEFQIRDRFSFLRFLGLTPEGTIPRRQGDLGVQAGAEEKGLLDGLFAEFDADLSERG